MIPLTEQPGGVRFALKVVPGASRSRIVGELGDALKIAVSKPPQDGAANKAVLKLLCDQLHLSPASVSIVRGHGNPRKEVLVSNITVADLAERLNRILPV